MKTHLLLMMVLHAICAVRYNQPCPFTTGTCEWSIGRRWHTVTLHDQNKVLVADAASKVDKRTGFTDTITSSWLHLSSLCAFDVRLTFRYSIANAHDLMEIYLVNKNATLHTSLGHWNGAQRLNQSADVDDSVWQHGNVTFRASEEFRIDIEVRHRPGVARHSVVWFAIDDILIESCPVAIVNTTANTFNSLSSTISTPARSDIGESSTPLSNASDWILADSPAEPSSSRQTLLTLILYLFCALIALTLLIILSSIILFTYRKHCCLSRLNRHDRLRKIPMSNRIGIQVDCADRDYQTVKTIDSTVRPCFE